MARGASPPCGAFDFDQQIPLMQHGIRGIYLCRIRVSVIVQFFSKKYIVPIEILFYLCYITFVINEITKYKSNGGIYDENCSCGIQWKGEPCDY